MASSRDTTSLVPLPSYYDPAVGPAAPGSIKPAAEAIGSLGSWLGESLYNTAMLPYNLYHLASTREGRRALKKYATEDSVPARAVEGAVSGLSLPGDAYSGRQPMWDPETGHTDVGTIGRAVDLGGLGFIGAMPAVGAERGALTAGLGRAAGRTVETVDRASDPWYSAVRRTVERSSQSRASPEQWRATLGSTPGVKGEELEWLGMPTHTGPVTRQQMLEHIDERTPQLQEVWKGVPSDKDDIQHIREWIEDVGDPSEIPPDATPQQIREIAVQQGYDSESEIGDFLDDTNHGVRYQQYSTPGLENYRELLLTLPPVKPKGNILATAQKIAAEGGDTDWFALGPQTQASYIKDAENLLTTKGSNYQSSHWDEPNVLGHVRMGDRTIDGQRTLHLDELQSDWHQAGRKNGYKTADPLLIKEAEDKMNTARAALQDHLQKMKLTGDEVQNALARAREGKIPSWVLGDPVNEHLATDFIDAQAAYHDINKTTGVPDAPFKKTWPDLLLKRAVREAAEGGYDQLSWTSGATQADRYDLSKRVKEIEYVKDGDKYKLGIITHDGSGLALPKPSFTKEELLDVVGKEIAEKIVNGEGKKYRGHDGYTLEGLDLKVGGEGMKAFYDRELPARAKKLFKTDVKTQSVGGTDIDWDKFSKATGQSVSELKNIWRHMPEKERQAHIAKYPASETVHVLPITPELRQRVLGEGQALFSGGRGRGVGAAVESRDDQQP